MAKLPGNIRMAHAMVGPVPSGNVLLALSQSKKYPGGAAVEVTKDGKVLFEFKGTQAEVNTVQAVDKDHYLLTEAGPKPRLLEVNREGQIIVEVPLQAQTKDHHLQSRMARKPASGNYLVPQLLDKVVREYSPDGKVVWEVKTSNMPFEVTMEKKVVWTHHDAKKPGIHHFQILDTNGKALEERPLR
jgi:hypothetical protein